MLFLLALITNGCDWKTRSMEVTATAYTSSRWETSGNPTLTAWQDTLEPDMKAIAVSRDLIEEGLTHGTRVSIEGREGEYIVRDKMNRRWEKKIDIYFGNDREAAREFGKKKVTIHWNPNNP